ncbi:MAG: hypothetical protein C0402_04015 [Thermodesulfovibrio sp.]|nr:hypothetical protein [Thermodesulfovibrio sp.]
MNPERLLQNFDRLIDTPDAVPRLRRFILDLAVRGKLVEQYPEDEPAGELLKRIEGEKKRLVKAGTIKEQKPLTPIDIATTPFDPPSGWKWTRLGATVNNHFGGGTPSKSNFTYWDGDIFWASVKDIGKTKYVDQTIDRISEDGLKNSSSNLIPPGNLIVVTRMGLGKVSINQVPMAINQDLRALILSSFASIDFYYIFFKTASYEGSGLTVKGIKVEELLNFPFPLPPLAEQHRIVAKVDELMKLCDELEVAQAKRERRRNRLVAATLHGLNNGKVDNENGESFSFEDSARFYFNHLPRLTTRAEHIQQLRQTILNLAVRGKLVEQDPKDEPSERILTDISSVQRRNTKDNEKQQRNNICDHEMLFISPPGWCWSRIGQLCDLVSGHAFKAAEYSKSGARLFQIANVSFGKTKWETLNYLPLAYMAAYPDLVLNPGDLVMALNRPLLNGQMKAAILSQEDLPAILYQRVGKIVFFLEEVLNKYFLLYLQSSHFVKRLEENLQGSDQPFINKSQVMQFLVPLPPLGEQHRIVAKVDELMALCDEMEGRISTNTTTSRKFLEATLQAAL